MLERDFVPVSIPRQGIKSEKRSDFPFPSVSLFGEGGKDKREKWEKEEFLMTGKKQRAGSSVFVSDNFIWVRGQRRKRPAAAESERENKK